MADLAGACLRRLSRRGVARHACANVTEPLAQRLGQPVVVENKSGAGGVIGGQQMLASAGYGHTLGTTINSPLTTARRLMEDTSYNVAPVTLIATSPLVLAVSADSAITDRQSFVEASGAEP